MTTFYDLSGRLTVAFDDPDRRAAGAVERQMDPFSASSSGPGAPDVHLARCPGGGPREYLDIQNTAHDAIVTASDGKRTYVLSGGRACAIPDPSSLDRIRIEYDDGFPVDRLFRLLMRPSMQVALCARGSAAVHGAAVEVDGRAALVAGWSETGKTEAALALMENGAGFLSDKWTVLGPDGHASAFPISVGVRRWALPFVPRLAASLPRRSRRRMRLAAIADGASRPVRRHATSGGVASHAADLCSRAVAVAERAAVTPSELRRAYGQTDDPSRRVRLGVVILLTTVPGESVVAEPVAPAWAARRLARTAAYERRFFFSLLDRARYASATQDAPGGLCEPIVTAEAQLLRRLLDAADVVEVRAPFPCDPRRIAAAVEQWL